MSVAETPVALRVELAGRRLGKFRRSLRVVAHPIELVLTGALAPCPPPGRDGYLFTATPVGSVSRLQAELADYIVVVRQTFQRHYVPMAGLGFDDWWRGFSGKTRSSLARKARRLDSAVGGFSVRAYRTVDEIREFMAVAGELSDRTYQARLLQAGLPRTAAAVDKAVGMAAGDNIRGFILFAGDRPLAYLYLPVEDDVVIYGFVGYDPAYGYLSPGNVLQVEAMRALFAEGRFRYFDFTGGEGSHKALFGRGSATCADVIALRPTAANRFALATINVVDTLARLGKRILGRR